jgi:hypothetical protein
MMLSILQIKLDQSPHSIHPSKFRSVYFSTGSCKYSTIEEFYLIISRDFEPDIVYKYEFYWIRVWLEGRRGTIEI